VYTLADAFAIILQTLYLAARVIYAIALTGLIFLPFIYHHYTAYVAFCIRPDSANLSPSPVPPWCHNFPPLIYTYIQSHYWNVGLFKYWTPQQIPNFLISAPPLALLCVFSIMHIKNVFLPQLWFLLSHQRSGVASSTGDEHELKTADSSNSPFFSPSLTPHAIHALFLSGTFLFASHTQIILRLAPSMPILYWSAAWLLLEGTGKWGRQWVAWSLIWGAVSSVLWTTFLPPA
jgi:GPI mannosyltransferase 2